MLFLGVDLLTATALTPSYLSPLASLLTGHSLCPPAELQQPSPYPAISHQSEPPGGCVTLPPGSCQLLYILVDKREAVSAIRNKKEQN